MHQVKAFRETNHEQLAQVINDWLNENNALAISIAVHYGEGLGAYFHAFVIYEIQ